MLYRVAGFDREIRDHVQNTIMKQLDNFDSQSTLRTILKYAGVLVIVTLSACASIPEIPESVTSQPMDPIPKPEWSVGMSTELVSTESEERGGYEIIDVLEGGALKIASKRNGNCEYVIDTDWFSPPISWEKCGSGEWSSGTQAISSASGKLWPLTAGAKATYTRTPTSSTGKKGTPETRKCEVFGPLNVSLTAGKFDAMKVVCKTRRYDNSTDTRTWYWTNEHREIKYRRSNNTKGVIEDWEMAMIDQ